MIPIALVDLEVLDYRRFLEYLDYQLIPVDLEHLVYQYYQHIQPVLVDLVRLAPLVSLGHLDFLEVPVTLEYPDCLVVLEFPGHLDFLVTLEYLDCPVVLVSPGHLDFLEVPVIQFGLEHLVALVYHLLLVY